jgi:hypothetical protein
MACVVSDRRGVSERSLEVKARCSWEGTLFFKQSALRYWPIATKLIPIVWHVQWVIDVEFQKDPWNRRQDAMEKVLCSSSKVPFVIDQSQPILGHAHWVRDMEFQKDPWDRRQDTMEKVLCSSVKSPTLLTVHTKTCTNCRTCAESNRCGFSV